MLTNTIAKMAYSPTISDTVLPLPRRPFLTMVSPWLPWIEEFPSVVKLDYSNVYK
jgi:hypothetical protein